MKCNQSRPGFELVSPCSFPTTITITPRAPQKKVTIIPIVIDALGTVNKRLIQGLKDLEIIGRVELVQTTALRSARILRRVLNTWGDLLSLKHQWEKHQLTLMWKTSKEQNNNNNNNYGFFYINVNWWFYTGVWMTASILKSPGLVSGFWPFLAMLSFG